jgi:hypothetical protein
MRPVPGLPAESRQGFTDSRREQPVAPAIQQRGPPERLF